MLDSDDLESYDSPIGGVKFMFRNAVHNRNISMIKKIFRHRWCK